MCHQVSCVESVHELLHPTANNTTSRLVHAKANILTWHLALVACPLKTLHRVAQVRGDVQKLNSVILPLFKSCKPKGGSLAPMEKPREQVLIHWLHIILPGLSSHLLLI